MTTKTSDKLTTSNHKLLVLIILFYFLKIAWWLSKSYSAQGYVAYLELFQNHLK